MSPRCRSNASASTWVSSRLAPRSSLGRPVRRRPIAPPARADRSGAAGHGDGRDGRVPGRPLARAATVWRVSTKTESIAALEKARKAIDDAFAPMPDGALAYLKPGDDYAIGGIVIHLIQSLDGYIATLEALGQAGLSRHGGASRGRVRRPRTAPARAPR